MKLIQKLIKNYRLFWGKQCPNCDGQKIRDDETWGRSVCEDCNYVIWRAND